MRVRYPNDTVQSREGLAAVRSAWAFGGGKFRGQTSRSLALCRQPQRYSVPRILYFPLRSSYHIRSCILSIADPRGLHGSACQWPGHRCWRLNDGTAIPYSCLPLDRQRGLVPVCDFHATGHGLLRSTNPYSSFIVSRLQKKPKPC